MNIEFLHVAEFGGLGKFSCYACYTRLVYEYTLIHGQGKINWEVYCGYLA